MIGSVPDPALPLIQSYQREEQPQEKIDCYTNRVYAVNVVLEKEVVSITLPNVTHDLAVHARVQHQGVHPTSLDERLTGNKVLEGNLRCLGVLDQFKVTQEVFHVGIGQLVFEFSSQVLALVFVPVALDVAARGHLGEIARLLTFDSHTPSDTACINVHNCLTVLDVLCIQYQ
jgi:hypothetical protein